MRRLATEGRLLAIGECGLDYYRDLSPRELQHAAFRRQIALAGELELPMIFHVRDAYDDARAILEEEGLPPRRGIFHAFAGDATFARWAVEEGFKLGIGGVLMGRLADRFGILLPALVGSVVMPLGLMLAAQAHGLQVRTLDLRNSGDTAGDKHRVVGYGAYALV